MTNDLSIGGSDGGLNTVLTGFFDLIHRLVRGLHQFISRRRYVGQRGDPD